MDNSANSAPPSVPVEIPEIKLTNQEGAIAINNGKPRRKLKRIILPILGVILAIVLILAIAIGIPVFAVYKKARVVENDVKALQESVNKQSMMEIKSGLTKLKADLGSVQGSYKILGWTKILPGVGNYYKDGEAGLKGGIYGIDAAQVMVDTVEPYADIIGFSTDKSKEAQSGEESANDRIEFVVKTIHDIIPKMEVISQKVKLAQTEFNKIDPNRYPETFRGKKIRENLKQGLDLVDELSMAVTDSKPLLEQAPYLLGIDSPRTFLILFQNDKERRPTGGFITGYSIMSVNKGKVQPVSSNDIYNMDKKYTPSIPAPDPVVKYIKGVYSILPKYRLRDMNFNPDFKLSMDMFSKEAQKTGIPKIDGIIAVDTYVVVKLLEVLGEVGVPAYGNFSTKNDSRCNCPQVIYELESFADVEGAIVWDQNDPTKIIFAPPNFYNRKEIVGPLMNSVLRNALGQPKEKIPGLFKAGWESLTEKHVLFYMFDPKVQAGVESFNIAGRIKEYDGDYLHVNDANLGGRKSNLYTKEEVQQDVSIARDGSVEKTVTLTYKNPQGYDGWLNSVLPTWVRVYVPKGSQLVSSDGFTDKAEPYEELGKTVFAGGFQLRPQGVVKVTLKYKLPFKVKGEYKVLVQKQPGLDMPLYTINVGRQKDELFLKTDQEFKYRL